MIPLMPLLVSLQSLMFQQAPEGMQLNVRLSTTIGSFASKPGTPISAVIIAPVSRGGHVLIPAGSVVSGTVTKVTRVGLGVIHERAALALEFDRMTMPGAQPIPFSSRILEVDNARERVTAKGAIQGIRSTGSISYRVSGYVRTALLWDVHADAAEWAIKSLVLQLPEPEIYYPAGTELTLKLATPMLFALHAEPRPMDEALSDDQLNDIETLIASMPMRTQDPETKRPSDLTNVMLIGSREEIAQAFRAAGWSQPQRDSIRARIGCIRAAAEVHGFESAPMTRLLLNGVPADMSWQKSLNDVSKRHHIRIWKQPGEYNGKEVWMAAATRDVDFAYMRPGRPFTHEIDPKVDEEREKVVNDLAFTFCARPIAWTQRPAMPRFTRNATGDAIATDTRLVVLEMNACPSPRNPIETSTGEPPLVARGNKFQRFVRREIIITRNDLLRTNIYYRSYEASRWAFDYIRYRKKKASELRTLMAEFGPSGSEIPETLPHNSPLTLQTLR